MEVTIVYNDEKDKELLNCINTTVPFFVEYISINNSKSKKEGFRLMKYWSTKKLPLVIIKLDEKDANPIIKYSDIGENAINQLIKFLNEY